MNKTNLYTMPVLFKFIDWIYKNPGCGLYLASKHTNITYSYLGKMKRDLIKEGWLESKPNGRRIKMEFTIKGKKIAEVIVYLKQLLEESEYIAN